MRDWLIRLRNGIGISQQELAERIGVSREYITMIESNKRTPSVLIAKRIAFELKFDWTNFFDNKSNKTILDETG